MLKVLDDSEVKDLLAQLKGWKKGETLADTPAKNNLEIQHTPYSELIQQRVCSQITETWFPQYFLPPKYNCYRDGMSYGIHADSPFMDIETPQGYLRVRVDFSMTLWLTDDYDGGELCVGGAEYKGKPGEAMIYRGDQLHEVKPVTRGERICAITWGQSFFQPEERSIMAQISALPRTPELAAVIGRLARKWSE